MTTIKDIIEYTETFAPLDTAADFDNCGLLVGDSDTQIENVLIALDITPQVVKEAVERSAQLIISHHPVIFNPLKNLGTDSVPYLLAQCGIAALCLHTNLDRAEDDGVNICLAKALELENIRLYTEDFLCIGELSREMTTEEFAAFVKEKLFCSAVAFTKGDRRIKTVAVSSGAGSDEYHTAIALGADVFLTGEAKHHQYLEAEAKGVSLVTAGHFNTEDIAMIPLKEKLCAKFKDVKFICSETSHDPINYI